jgi:hypothetical protein
MIEREEEVDHRKHRKKRKGEGVFSVLFRDFRGSKILGKEVTLLGGSV